MIFEEEELFLKERNEIGENELNTILEPRLQRFPFHVTTPENYTKIVSDGFIKNNKNEDLPIRWNGSRNSYFKNMGCVSVCDLIGLEDTSIKEKSHYMYGNYYFLNPIRSDNKVVHILLDPSIRNSLISSKEWKICDDLSQKIAPRLEFGFKGDIPISLFSKVIKTHITFDEK